jgi:hypothetical protein
MACIQSRYHRRPGDATRSSAKAARQHGGPAAISGTWDFKWAPGTRIRIAFQKLPADVHGVDFEQGKALVKQKLEAWFGGRKGKGFAIPAPHLSYEIVADLPAPPLATTEPRSAKSKGGATAFIEYDVLISFLPLPVVLPATEQHDEEVIGTSSSELGRYAQRIEYGVPTAYLGPQPNRENPDHWFSSPEGIFTVTHELGHVLGMAHEQQNPRLQDRHKLKWKDLDKMVEITKNKGGLGSSISIPELILTEMKEPWPGELAFSDWREPPKIPSDLSQLNFDSVLTKPSLSCLLVGGHANGFDCTHAHPCPFEQAAIERLSEPTNGDLEHLVYMYGRSPEAGRPRHEQPAEPSGAGAYSNGGGSEAELLADVSG